MCIYRLFFYGTHCHAPSLPQGGVLLVSHDEYLIGLACKEVWLCRDHTVQRLEGGLAQYKAAVQAELKQS